MPPRSFKEMYIRHNTPLNSELPPDLSDLTKHKRCPQFTIDEATKYAAQVICATQDFQISDYPDATPSVSKIFDVAVIDLENGFRIEKEAVTLEIM